jgi:hypothetical protein
LALRQARAQFLAALVDQAYIGLSRGDGGLSLLNARGGSGGFARSTVGLLACLGGLGLKRFGACAGGSPFAASLRKRGTGVTCVIVSRQFLLLRGRRDGNRTKGQQAGKNGKRPHRGQPYPERW